MKKSYTESNQNKSSKYARANEELFGLEDDFNLLNKKIDDTYFWERIRLNVREKILSSLFSIGQPSTGLGHDTFLSYGMSALKNIFLKNPLVVSNHEILFYGHQRRKKGDDGRYWDIYVDPILNDLDLDYVYYETSFSGKHFQPPKTSNIKYTDLISLGLIGEKLGIVPVNCSKKDKLYINKIENEIKNRFSVNIDLLGMIKSTIISRKIMLPIYSKILEKVDPKLVVLVVSYGRETFIEACKKRNIPVIELQHGVIYKYHFGYSFPGKGSKKMFPDYLFTFGDYWKDAVKYPIDKKHIYSIGYPYFENERKSYSDSKKKNQILFISQPGRGEELSKFAVELSQNDKVDSKLVYKIHPKQYGKWRSKYPWLRKSSIKVVEDEVSLYEIFASSEIQIGVNSTAIFEGLAFNLDTYLLNVSGVEIMENLINNKYAKLIDGIDDFIRNYHGTNSSDKNRMCTDDIFKTYEKEKVKRLIEKLK